MYVEQDVIMLGDRCQHSLCQHWEAVCACTREIIRIYLCACLCVYLTPDDVEISQVSKVFTRLGIQCRVLQIFCSNFYWTCIFFFKFIYLFLYYHKLEHRITVSTLFTWKTPSDPCCLPIDINIHSFEILKAALFDRTIGTYKQDEAAAPMDSASLACPFRRNSGDKLATFTAESFTRSILFIMSSVLNGSGQRHRWNVSKGRTNLW